MINNWGSKIYCNEDLSNIENYEKAISDNTQTWQLHHRLETHKYKDRSRKEWVKRDETVSVAMLKAFGLYYHRPAEELIFLTENEHKRLHRQGYKNFCKHTDEFKKAAAERAKGNTAHKGHKHTDETKQRISKAKTGSKHTEETKKKMSESHKGKRYGQRSK